MCEEKSMSSKFQFVNNLNQQFYLFILISIYFLYFHFFNLGFLFCCLRLHRENYNLFSELQLYVYYVWLTIFVFIFSEVWSFIFLFLYFKLVIYLILNWENWFWSNIEEENYYLMLTRQRFQINLRQTK